MQEYTIDVHSRILEIDELKSLWMNNRQVIFAIQIFT